KAWGAVAALRCAEVCESFLQRMKIRAFGHAFDGRHVAAFHVQAESEARKNRSSVNEHGACAALAKLATVLRTRQNQIFAQDSQKSLVRRKDDFDRLVVKRELNMSLLSGSFGHNSIIVCEKGRLSEIKNVINRDGQRLS